MVPGQFLHRGTRSRESCTLPSVITKATGSSVVASTKACSLNPCASTLPQYADPSSHLLEYVSTKLPSMATYSQLTAPLVIISFTRLRKNLAKTSFLANVLRTLTSVE